VASFGKVRDESISDGTAALNIGSFRHFEFRKLPKVPASSVISVEATPFFEPATRLVGFGGEFLPFFRLFGFCDTFGSPPHQARR
jgi:hypothetical protein